MHRLLPPALALAIPLLALGLYLKIGHPGLPAAPFVAGAKPPAEQPMDIAQLVAQARARVAAEPNNADTQSALGEALTLEADGTVTPAAVDAFNKALAAQPGDARSLYYLGLHDAQAGDSATALRRWQELEAKSPPNAPFLPMLRAEMARVAQAAGLPANTTMPQPSREQQEAMAALTPEQRQQAIRGMVEGLAVRMKENPQDRGGWLRLANAWKVLGENASAIDAYAKADALGPVDARVLADWAEAHVRGLKPGEPPSPRRRGARATGEGRPRNGLALFYLGAASFAPAKRRAARAGRRCSLSLPADAPIRAMLEDASRKRSQECPRQ